MKIKVLHPLISCICITAYRPELLLKSILIFEQQNYPNTELVVSYPADDALSNNLIKHVKDSTSIQIVEVLRAGSESIGKARNDAINQSNGDLVAIWDDDDLYQYNRIADQYNLLSGNGRYFQASLLKQIILYDDLHNQAYLSFSYMWSNTLLCRKSHLVNYPCEDRDHFEMQPVLNFLQKEELLLTDILNPYLYISVYHGLNQINYYHFQYYKKRSHILDDQYAQHIKNYFRQKLQISTS